MPLKQRSAEMADDLVNKNKSGAFSFGLVVFSITILIPVAAIMSYAYFIKTEQDIKMKCIEQGKTYVNSMCLSIPASTK